MQAVFYMSEYDNCGLQSGTVHLFDSEDDAYDFAFDKLVQTGLIEVLGEGLYRVDKSNVRPTKKEAVNWAWNCLDTLEFLHIYEVVDRRESQTA